MQLLSSLKVLGLLGRRADIFLAVAVAMIIALIIVPLPPLLLDVGLTLNISLSVLILMAVLFSSQTLDLSSFPSLLLITTLFRLGLNVSTTRGILARGDAGEVVRAFGHFVVQGDVIVGAVIFLVITIVQFIVIAKGAERVAEVGARFTLDAMPGKQMSIDAALRAGAISDTEADRRRLELGRESQLFGNMDGAMKFVKGDAIAGLIITALNMVAGLSIGVLRFKLPASEALEVYTLLTVGDGLVSQVASLVITIAAGILVTRVIQAKSTQDGDGQSLGFAVAKELFGKSTSLWMGAGLLFILAMVPGLPGLPFLLVSGLMVVINLSRGFLPEAFTGLFDAEDLQELHDEVERSKAQALAQRSVTEEVSPSVAPISIELSADLSDALGFTDESIDPADTEFLGILVPQLRDALFLETGVRYPPVFVRARVLDLPPGTFLIRLDDVPVLRKNVLPDRALAIAPPEELRRYSVAAEPGEHPFAGPGAASVVAAESAEVLKNMGVQVWNTAGVVALYLASVLRPRAAHFLGLQEVSEMVERMEKAYPALVKEVLPKVVSVPQLLGVLKRLAEEGVSIRNLRAIFEALGEHGLVDPSPVRLTESVRTALGSQLAHAFAGLEQRLSVVLLDPIIEDTIESGIHSNADSEYLALDPEIVHNIVDSVKSAVRPIMSSGRRPVVLTRGRIRRMVRKLLEVDLGSVAVLSFEELPPQLAVQPLATATID